MYDLKELQDCTYFLLHCKGANLVDSTRFNIVFRPFLRYYRPWKPPFDCIYISLVCNHEEGPGINWNQTLEETFL